MCRFGIFQPIHPDSTASGHLIWMVFYFLGTVDILCLTSAPLSPEREVSGFRSSQIKPSALWKSELPLFWKVRVIKSNNYSTVSLHPRTWDLVSYLSSVPAKQILFPFDPVHKSRTSCIILVYQPLKWFIKTDIAKIKIILFVHSAVQQVPYRMFGSADININLGSSAITSALIAESLFIVRSIYRRKYQLLPAYPACGRSFFPSTLTQSLRLASGPFAFRAKVWPFYQRG